MTKPKQAAPTATGRALRGLPSVDKLLSLPQVQDLVRKFGRPLVLGTLQDSLAALRRGISEAGRSYDQTAFLAELDARLERTTTPSLLRVINASGTLLHTNLGRAPLSAAALQAAFETAGSYTNLEYDLQAGKRSHRYLHASEILRQLTGAQAALVVNNNAGALLLALSALAKGKKVAISRAELVEIGGGFRIPDVMRASGAKLLEVGTTNRTRLADFEAAIADGAQVLLAAHASNFRIIGFTESPRLADLAQLARANGLPLLHDLGSGALLDTAVYGLPHEPTVQESLKAGASLVCFSGDKLLGGPQAGILLGEAALVAKCARHPLYRALRPDKITLALLSQTLLHYLRDEAPSQIPLHRMLGRAPADLEAQSRDWQAQLGQGSVVQAQAAIGGGSLPEEYLPGPVLALKVKRPDRFLACLRGQKPAIIARISEDLVMIDPRTVQPGEEAELLAGLAACLKTYEVKDEN